ncbi:protein of unknown function [Candidatus Nitrospira inopinata]|uniref:Uncharacterized protein n=1 Tax=Candidatus Nitrospira inopinata TaxID=1715989 RepID=A0A0S4KQB9_9BACT|nr:protein of unknown function [Candidatus Nitrospira inopinata]
MSHGSGDGEEAADISSQSFPVRVPGAYLV